MACRGSTLYLGMDQGQCTHPGALGVCRIDPGLGAAATRVPAASREDSRPQAILKLHRPSSLDYRAHHGLPVYRVNKSDSSFYIMTNWKIWLNFTTKIVFCNFLLARISWKKFFELWNGATKSGRLRLVVALCWHGPLSVMEKAPMGHKLYY